MLYVNLSWSIPPPIKNKKKCFLYSPKAYFFGSVLVWSWLVMLFEMCLLYFGMIVLMKIIFLKKYIYSNKHQTGLFLKMGYPSEKWSFKLGLGHGLGLDLLSVP